MSRSGKAAVDAIGIQRVAQPLRRELPAELRVVWPHEFDQRYRDLLELANNTSIGSARSRICGIAFSRRIEAEVEAMSETDPKKVGRRRDSKWPNP